MKRIIAILFAFLVGFAQTWAATLADNAPKTLPLADLATLMADALKKVNHGVGGVSGQSVSGTTWFSQPITTNNNGDPLAIAAFIKKQKLNYSVDPTEKLSHFVGWEIRTADGSSRHSAFWGEKDFSLVKDASGVWQVKAEDMKLTDMEFGYSLLEAKGLNNAYIVLRDKNGNVTGYYYFSDEGLAGNGYVALAAKHVGQTGDLYLGFNDGSKAIYSLTDGKVRSVTTVAPAEGLETSAKGVLVYADNSSDILVRQIDYVIRAKYTVETTVTVRFETGSKLPAAIKLVDADVFAADSNTPGVVYDPSKTAVSFKVPAGKTILLLVNRGTTVNAALPANNGKG